MPRRVISRIPLMPLAGLAIVVVAGIAALLLSFGVSRANHWVAHSIRTQVGIVAVGERLSAFESAYRGYLIRRNPTLLAEAQAMRRDLAERLADLGRETADDAVQQHHQVVLARLIALRISGAVRLMRYRTHLTITDLPPLSETQHLMVPIRRQIATMFAIEEQRLEVRQRWLQTLTVGLALFLVGAVLVVVVVAYLTVGDATARYAELQHAHHETQVEMAKRESAESQLRQMQKMETIGQLTGGIAHDFNNMLAVIIGSLDVARAQMDRDPARLAHAIDAAQDGAGRAAQLVTRLLAFSRNQPLSPVPVDTAAMMAAMSDLLRRTLGDGISIETAPAAGLWLCFADPVQLESAILNLAVNARDAMDGRGGRLTLSAANKAVADDESVAATDLEPGEYVMLSVSDTGAGMSPAVLERAFEPFFTTKEVGKGTGLGLSQVFGFARQSGGAVAIGSREGEGTTVRLYLPRYHGTILPERRLAPVAPARGTPDELILVVEDEPHVRRFSANALRDLGYGVICAGDGVEGLRIIGQEPGVRMLFTDMMMPGMNGRALAEAARRLRPDLRVLYTTGFARDELEETDAALVATTLRKPFTLAQLAACVRKVLDAG